MKEILEQLLADGVIDEVIGRLKSGKEADVYLVRHHGEIVAAKVYKDRAQRNFKSNAVYKEGRQIRNSRTRRAVEKGSRFGQREAEEAWKSAEADALYRLHAEGVRVPTPKMFYEGVLLMQLVTDAAGDPAPRLIDAPIAMEAAGEIYRDLRRAMVGMLCCEMIHGDLSPYNVLLGVEGAIIIDFPQMMSAAHNNQSEGFFRRDFENIHRFLCGIDRSLLRSRSDGFEIWRAYLRRELTPEFEPTGVAVHDVRYDRKPPPRQDPPRPNLAQTPQPPRAPRPPSPPPHPRFAGVQAPPREQHRDQPPAREQRRDQPPARSSHGRPPPQRSGGRPMVPEVMYVRRPGQAPTVPPPIVDEPEHQPAPRTHEPPPRPPPQPQRRPPNEHPAQQHRQQHRAPHPSHAQPPPRSQSPREGYRSPESPPQNNPAIEVRDSSERKGPRRRRRGRGRD